MWHLAFALAATTSTGAHVCERAFNGRWRLDQKTLQSDSSPTVLSLKDGLFSRGASGGAQSIEADGLPHRVSDVGYVDESVVSILGPRRVREVNKLRGKVVYVNDYSVDRGGDVLTWRVASYANPSGRAVRVETRQRRIGLRPAGGHPISGTWGQTGLRLEEGANDWVLSLRGRTFGSWSPQGVGYEAVVDGPPVPIVGDGAGTVAVVTMPAPDTIVERDVLHGEVGGVLTMRLMPDCRTIAVTTLAPKTGDTGSFTLHRR